MPGWVGSTKSNPWLTYAAIEVFFVYAAAFDVCKLQTSGRIGHPR